MAVREGLEKARKLAETAQELYPELKRSCEREVVEWEWASEGLYSLEPAYFEINKYPLGKRLPGEPSESISGVVGYGFDAKRRLLVERSLTEFPGRFYETFYRHEPGGTARLYFHYTDKTWISAAFLSHDDAGRVCSLDATYAVGSTASKTYSYDDQGRLRSVEITRDDPRAGVTLDYRDLEYDAEGQIARVYWRYPDGSRLLHFERPDPTRTFAALRQTIADGLVGAIVGALEQQPPQAPIFALAIIHCDAHWEHRVPADVVLGLEAERTRFVESHGSEAPRLIWNPAEWETLLSLDLSDELAQQCASASQDIWQNDLQEEADLFLAELAQRLAELDLPVARTEDFITYAIALDCGDIVGEVAARLDPERAAAFRERGLL